MRTRTIRFEITATQKKPGREPVFVGSAWIDSEKVAVADPYSPDGWSPIMFDLSRKLERHLMSCCLFPPED